MTTSTFGSLSGFPDSGLPGGDNSGFLGKNLFPMLNTSSIISQALLEDLHLFGVRESMDEVDRLDTFDELDSILILLEQSAHPDEVIRYFHGFLDSICLGSKSVFGKEWFAETFDLGAHPVVGKQSFSVLIHRCEGRVFGSRYEEFRELVGDFCGLLDIQIISLPEQPETNTTWH